MMYITDNMNKTIVWCNQNMINETGYTLKEMKNMGIEFFKIVMHPDDFLKAKKIQEEFSKGSRDSVTGFCRFRNKNMAPWRIFFGTAVPFSYTKQGEVKELCCLFQPFPPTFEILEQEKVAFHILSNRYTLAILGELTERETKVLQLLKKGNNAPAIARELLLGYETVRKCLTRLREKFRVHTVQALVTIANELGL